MLSTQMQQWMILQFGFGKYERVHSLVLLMSLAAKVYHTTDKDVLFYLKFGWVYIVHTIQEFEELCFCQYLMLHIDKY